MKKTALLLAFTAACTAPAPAPTSVGVDPAEQASSGKSDSEDSLALPDVRCDGIPDAGPPTGWLHPAHAEADKALGLGVVAHRGIDFAGVASTNPQVLRGEMRYGTKSIENESVTVFACRDGAWQSLGSVTTDDNGAFSISLADDQRLPIGVRSMYVSLDGDRSGTNFVTAIAPDGSGVAFSDVDGTLTSSENAVVGGVFGLTVAANDGAAAALTALANKGYPIVYVTSMPRTFTKDRRDWLDANGFPRGALRMPPDVLLAGSATSDYKTTTFEDVASTGLVPTIGLGNRATDATAYSAVAIEGDHIFLKLGEFDSEDQPIIDAGGAVGVTSYADQLATFQSLPNAR